MGNNSSQATTKGAVPVVATTKVEPFKPVVEVVRTQKIDAHYGEHKVVKDKKTGQEYIQKEIVLNNKQTFDNEVNYIKNRISLKHDNVINVLGYDTEEKSGFCATHYKIIIYIEPLSRTLEQVVTEKNKTQQYFPEYELRSIAVSLINGLAFFQSKGFSHGDIRPSNIFFDEKTKTVKLSDPTLHQTKGFNGLLAHIIRKEKSYLAPELLVNVPKERLEFKGNANKADVYSLGMTLLALATLTDSGDLYDYKQGKIFEDLLQKRIESLNRNYPGGGLESIIRVMLNAKPEERADFVALSSQYGSDVHHHHTGEVEKRSVHHVVEHHVDDHADLEARIKAALERSAATFRSVGAHSHHDVTYTTVQPVQTHETVVSSIPHHHHHVEPVVNTTQYQYHVEPVVSTIPTHHHHETVVSSIPHHHYEYSVTPIQHHETVVSSVPQHQHHHHHHDHHHVEPVVNTSQYQYHVEPVVNTSQYQYHVEPVVNTTQYQYHVEPVVSTIPTHHHETVVSSVPHHHHHETAVVAETHHESDNAVIERALRSAMASSHLHTTPATTTVQQVETTHHHVEPVATVVSTTGQSNLRNSDFLRKSFLASHIPSTHTTTTYTTAPVTTYHDHGEQAKRSTHIVDVAPTNYGTTGGYTDVSYTTYQPSSYTLGDHHHHTSVAPVNYTYTTYSTSHGVPSTFTETVHDALNVKQSTSVNEIANQ